MRKKRSMGSHQSGKMKNDEWITPRWILARLGTFDLDPCSPTIPPWHIASELFDKSCDGLAQEWVGRVWLNPPFGRVWAKWVCRLAAHGNGIALLAARTETKDFFEQVWEKADAILFIRTRPHFHYVDGRKGELNSGAPIVLVAYGRDNASILKQSGLGMFLRLTRRKQAARANPAAAGEK